MELQQLLTETAQRKASDLHLKPGSRPILRIHGHLEVQDDLPVIPASSSPRGQDAPGRAALDLLMEGREMDLGYMCPASGASASNVFLSQGEVRAVFRHVPERIPTFEELHLPKVLERLCDGAPRDDPRHRHHRLRQVDHARRHDRLHEPLAATITSSRSRTRSSSCTRTTSA